MTETTTAAGRAPIPAGHQSAWDRERLEAAHLSASVLEHLTGEVSACITTAHGHGLAVPASVVEAVGRLQALAAAWQANSQGHPIDPGVRAALAL